MKLIKRLLKILVALVLFVVIAAVALVFLFDPNVFKPRIEALAQEQGVRLNIDGNLGWQLWPALGVEVNGIRVAAESAPEEEIARLEKASLLLAIRPLFQGEVSVHHIAVDGAAVDLRVNEEGVGNWEELLPDETAEAEQDDQAQPEVQEGQALQLAVERISVNNASLRYRDASTGQDLELSPLNLDISDFNLQGSPFSLDLGLQASITDQELLGEQPLLVAGQLSGEITLAEDFDTLQLEDGRLRLELERNNNSDDIRLNVSAHAQNLTSEPQYRGQVSLEPFNPKALMAVLSLPAPEMASAEALTRLAVQLTFAGTAEQISADPLRVELDDTRIDGRVAVTDLSSNALQVMLRGDQINIDDYLPPSSEEEEPEETSEATGDEELIPLDVIRDLDAELSLDFDALTIMDLAMQNLSVRVLARNGVVELQRAQLEAYNGQLEANGSLDGTGATAVMEMVAELTGLELGPLLSDLEFDEKVQLTGALNSEIQGKTRGVTMNEIMAALNAEASFSGAQVRLAPLNIEQKFCQVVNLVTRSDASDKSWPEYTEMTELSGRATVKNQVVTLESLQAGVEQLAVSAEGTLDLEEAVYDFTLPLQLGSESTSSGGCQINSNYWINSSLSLLRCRGSLEELNPVSDCRPDARGLESLVKDFAEYKVREQHGERIDAERARAEERVEEEKARAEQKVEEEKQRLRDRVRERLSGDEEENAEDAEGGGDDGEQSTEDRIRDLFGR